MKSFPFKAEILLAITVFLGFTLLTSSSLSLVYSGAILVYGLYKIFVTKNAYGAAHIISAFVVGIEVLFRMNSGGLGYEFGKYATILFLVFGMMMEKKKRPIPYPFVVFILLLLPSILVVDYPTFDETRQMVSFNLSGPICLGISVIYFYKRKIPVAQLRKIFLSIIYPIAAMSIYLYLRSGDLKNIEFDTDSNFETSGGFGPNQVSTVFGLGILVIAIAYFLNIKLFTIKYLNIALLFIFLVRGLATFSRGGVIAPAVAIVLCIVIMSLTTPNFHARIGKIVYSFLIIFTAAFVGFNYVNDASRGLLEMRFSGESKYDKTKDRNLFSGRDEIFIEDLEVFKQNMFLGVGPGMAMEKREELSGYEVSAHVEYSRMISEHGLFGFVALFILLGFPVVTFFKLKSTDDKILLILCTVFVFVTLAHAATRVAVPCFIYGLGFANLVRIRK